VMQPIPGGAAARPFITHHNALDTEFYLRIANELYLKRCIVGGFDGVFEFSRNFRNEGMDRTHNPEFTVMELYVAYKDYLWMMDFIEGVFRTVATAANGSPTATFQGKEISFAAPFKRITMVGSIEEKIGLNVLDMEEDDIRALCMKHHIDVAPSMGKGKLIDELFSKLVQPELIQPTFVTDFPVEMSPLCKKHREDPRLTERFELFVAGFEVANAYSELNDPIDQRERFEDQLKLRPMLATSIGDKRYNDQYPVSISPEFRAKAEQTERDYLARVQQIDPAQLTGQDLLSYQVFKSAREREIEGFRFPDHLIPLNQFYSAQRLRSTRLRQRHAAV